MTRLAGYALFLSALSVAHAKPPADTQATLDAFIQGSPGGVSVAWVDADGPVFFHSGLFSADDSRAITPYTQYELGSVTKVFTALLLAESERLGKVARHDPAAKYLLPADDPDQAALARITLLSLTTHTSGLPRLPSNIGPNPDANPDPYAAYDRAMLVAALRSDGRAAPAGGEMAYSNFGAAVLGEALAAAWGTSYADALRVHVLTPLGMNATSLGMAGAASPANLAPAHARGVTVPNWTQQAFAAAGALRSSARDMSIFLSACLGTDGSPLRQSMSTVIGPQHAADAGGHIGMGWLLTDDPDRPVVWHNGATAGSRAFVGYCPKTGTAVAVMVNDQRGCDSIGFGLLGAKPPRPKVDAVRDAASYVGRYAISPAFAVDIREFSGGLLGQATGQSPFGMRPLAADRFSIIGIPAEISFERDGSGRVAALVLHQNGADHRGTRAELPAQPREVALPVEALREYVGRYPLAPAFILTVTERNGQLITQATGQPEVPVFASARDEFFLRAVDAQISFQRDASGKVSGLVLHQGGQNIPAPKLSD
jgi:serine-type D-Ala-D-Ala carboxypeptidase/endopeptidase